MRYEFDPTKDTAGFPVLPVGDYRLKVGEPKAFKGETKEGERAGQTNYGIAFTATVVEGPVDGEGNVSPKEHVGKKVYCRLYYHTQEARNYSKGYVLAIFGFTPKEEEIFNNKLVELKASDPENPMLDWGFDTDTGAVGHAWRHMTNAEFVASLGVEKGKKEGDSDQQKWLQVRPAPRSGNTVNVSSADVKEEVPQEA